MCIRDSPLGFERILCDDTNCCIVTSLAISPKIKFRESASYLAKYGREHRDGMFYSDIVKAVNDIKHCKVTEIEDYTHDNRITINQFVKKHPEGRYMCLVKGHVISIVNGVLYDHTEKPRRQIVKVWKFEDK